jgi:integrase
MTSATPPRRSRSQRANVKAVQRMLGHASAAMTLDTYADLFDDDLDAVAKALGEAKLASYATTHK